MMFCYCPADYDDDIYDDDDDADNDDDDDEDEDDVLLSSCCDGDHLTKMRFSAWQTPHNILFLIHFVIMMMIIMIIISFDDGDHDCPCLKLNFATKCMHLGRQCNDMVNTEHVNERQM